MLFFNITRIIRLKVQFLREFFKSVSMIFSDFFDKLIIELGKSEIDE